MTATDAGVLASLRLVRGRSDSPRQEFGRSSPQTVLTVGADPSCDWLVEEDGVAPIHFSIYWDGSTLRVADTHGAGRIRVDGVPVGGEWQRIGARARLDFGNAAIVVEIFGAAHGEGPWGPTTYKYKVTLAEVGPADAFGTHRGFSPSSSPAANSVRQTDSESKPRSHSSPPAAAGSARPARPVGGTSLADIDQRTMQGYVIPVQQLQVAPSVVHIAPSISITGGVAARSSEKGSRQAAVVEEQVVARLGTLNPGGSGASIVLRSPDDPRLRHGSRSGDSAFGQPGRSVSETVLVLSPVGGHAEQARLPRARLVSRSDAPPLAAWRSVGLSLFAMTVGYGCWLYLLYNL